MKISRQWLEDFVDLSDFSDEKLEELITTRVAEVEGVELSGEELQALLALTDYTLYLNHEVAELLPAPEVV